MAITASFVQKLYTRFVHKAQLLCDRHRYDKCLRFIKAASHTAYNFYLGYRDNEIEGLLKTLSHHVQVAHSSTASDDNSCVFYDSFSIDNGGLVQQYIAAIIHAGYEITFITERESFCEQGGAIYSQLVQYNKTRIIEIPKSYAGMRRVQFIYDTIVGSKAKKLFIHSSPSAVCANVAFYALPENIIKYKINLTDHTFWIGSGCVDYSLEFRSYGCYLSSEYRGISSDRIFHMPFYPIMSSAPFKGFPKEAEGKVILFAGGAYYKIYDNEDTFFKIAKAILDGNDSVLLFAGTGNMDTLNDKIKQYQLTGRFIPIGQRDDIVEVFKRCDIFINTYPFGGGLMSQYAAQCCKPILDYCAGTTASVEQFVCQREKMVISDSSIDDVRRKAIKLITDKEYRISYAKQIQKCAISPSEFNDLFVLCMNSHKNPVPYSIQVSQFEAHKMNIDDKLKYENENCVYQRDLVKILGLDSIKECPLFIGSSLLAISKEGRFISVLKSKIKCKKK